MSKEKPKKQSEIATNRLLDLLRAKDTVRSTRDSETAPDSKPKPETPADAKSPKEKEEAAHSLINALLEEDEPIRDLPESEPDKIDRESEQEQAAAETVKSTQDLLKSTLQPASAPDLEKDSSENDQSDEDIRLTPKQRPKEVEVIKPPEELTEEDRRQRLDDLRNSWKKIKDVKPTTEGPKRDDFKTPDDVDGAAKSDDSDSRPKPTFKSPEPQPPKPLLSDDSKVSEKPHQAAEKDTAESDSPTAVGKSRSAIPDLLQKVQSISDEGEKPKIPSTGPEGLQGRPRAEKGRPPADLRGSFLKPVKEEPEKAPISDLKDPSPPAQTAETAVPPKQAESMETEPPSKKPSVPKPAEKSPEPDTEAVKPDADTAGKPKTEKKTGKPPAQEDAGKPHRKSVSEPDSADSEKKKPEKPKPKKGKKKSKKKTEEEPESAGAAAATELAKKLKITNKEDSDQPKETSVFDQQGADEEEMEPDELDISYLTDTTDEVKAKSKSDALRPLISQLSESRRKITFFADEEMLSVMQIRNGKEGSEVEHHALYTLPFVKEDGEEIHNIQDLLNHVVNDLLEDKDKKNIYAAIAANIIQSKTHSFQTPKLNKKELQDLITWHAKKNLPFNPETSVSNFEIYQTKSEEKQEILMGIGDGVAIERTNALFISNAMRLRLFSTTPILLWKLFVKNYPECKNGCYVLIHIGEIKTLVVVVRHHRFLFSREIAIGTQDLYKAVMQRVIVDGEPITIDLPMAKDILSKYGFPQTRSGLTKGTRIDLYKISIFLRPVVERITGELNRSLNYFKKQASDLEWEEILFSGQGATFPHLLKVIEDNMQLRVGLLNPVRTETCIDAETKETFPRKQLPWYTINFALANDDAEDLNVLPAQNIKNFKFILYSKLAAIVTALLIPLFLFSGFLSTANKRALETRVLEKKNEWNNLSEDTKLFSQLYNDVIILDNFEKFLEDDRTNTINSLSLLKLISSVIPDDIKLTGIQFKRDRTPLTKSSDEGNDESGIDEAILIRGNDLVELSGFIKTEPSVADIYLTNFIIELESLLDSRNRRVFSSVNVSAKDFARTEDGRLLFQVDLRYNS